MRLNVLLVVAAFLALASAGRQARAQVPFFNATPTAFTPEISIVTTGTVNDVQATVSADRKYVTLNMRPANSALLALRSFTFQRPAAGFGFVGLPPAASDSQPRAAWDVRPKVQSNLLARPGMTRIDG